LLKLLDFLCGHFMLTHSITLAVSILWYLYLQLYQHDWQNVLLFPVQFSALVTLTYLYIYTCNYFGSTVSYINMIPQNLQ